MRNAGANPLTINEPDEIRYVYSGKGFNHQLSYVFPKFYELATRYSILMPDETISGFESRHEVLEAGVTKYIRHHRIKMQWNVSYIIREGTYPFGNTLNNWGTLLQVEFGI